jgi:hypothetical protein
MVAGGDAGWAEEWGRSHIKSERLSLTGYILGKIPQYARLVGGPGTILHVTARGNYQQPVFHLAEDRQMYLALLDRHSHCGWACWAGI